MLDEESVVHSWLGRDGDGRGLIEAQGCNSICLLYLDEEARPAELAEERCPVT